MTRTYRKTSIKDVARQAGVSTTTVSCFVNGREAVCGPETAARIRAAIAELHYTPSSLTRGLRQGATHTIGVCLYSSLDPEVRFGNLFFERLWRGVVAGADTTEYSLLHYPRSVRSGDNSDALLDGRVDGVLLLGRDIVRADKLSRAGLPAVLTNRAHNIPDGCGAAYADENQTVGLALRHLRDLGHRRIAYLSGPVGPHPDPVKEPIDDVAVRRLSAYQEQMHVSGDFDPDLLHYADAWRDENGRVAHVVARLHALRQPPTAVLCANDLLAVAVLDAASECGWGVPEKLSVVGIDDSAEARSARVPLTSIAVPIEEIGKKAVECLLSLMAGGLLDGCRVMLPVDKIVVRRSTASAAG